MILLWCARRANVAKEEFDIFKWHEMNKVVCHIFSTHSEIISFATNHFKSIFNF